jgi:hypothetical protein
VKRKMSKVAQLPKGWAKARAVLARHSKRLLRRTGVVGVDVGIKRHKGKLVSGPCIRVHVVEKIDASELHPRRKLPSTIEGVAVDVVQSSFRVRMACASATIQHRQQVDPIVGGCSIGRFGERAFGTLGIVALDANGSLGGVTCAHVCGISDDVRQPHRVGESIGVVIRELANAEIDASFVLFDGARISSPDIINFGSIPSDPFEVTASDLPIPVSLVGACSGRTSGKIVSTDFQGRVEYPDGERFMRGQLCIEAEEGTVFARGGDSGGALLCNGRVAGLLIAAGDPVMGGTGLATPISRILERLALRLP